jgi:hypothetical protein
MDKTHPEFWITNISNRNVSLSDLNLTIKAYTSVNLMDTRHYYYNLEQLKKSAESGSLFKKRDKLVVRKVAPIIAKAQMSFQQNSNIPSRERSIFAIKEDTYEELNMSDEEFAKENADMVDLDNLRKKV